MVEKELLRIVEIVSEECDLGGGAGLSAGRAGDKKARLGEPGTGRLLGRDGRDEAGREGAEKGRECGGFMAGS